MYQLPHLGCNISITSESSLVLSSSQISTPRRHPLFWCSDTYRHRLLSFVLEFLTMESLSV